MADLGGESHETRSLAQGGDDQATQSAQEAEDWAESINSFAGGSRVCVTERQTDRQTGRQTERREREQGGRLYRGRDNVCV
jgi:hypothetical protein